MDIDLDLWLKEPPSEVLAKAIGQGYVAENMGDGMVIVRADSPQSVTTDSVEREIIRFLEGAEIDKRWLVEHPGILRVACYVDHNRQASATIALSRQLTAVLFGLALSLELSFYPCVQVE
jgi:hypothetical protein